MYTWQNSCDVVTVQLIETQSVRPSHCLWFYLFLIQFISRVLSILFHHFLFISYYLHLFYSTPVFTFLNHHIIHVGNKLSIPQLLFLFCAAWYFLLDNKQICFSILFILTISKDPRIYQIQRHIFFCKFPKICASNEYSRFSANGKLWCWQVSKHNSILQFLEL